MYNLQQLQGTSKFRPPACRRSCRGSAGEPRGAPRGARRCSTLARVLLPLRTLPAGHEEVFPGPRSDRGTWRPSGTHVSLHPNPTHLRAPHRAAPSPGASPQTMCTRPHPACGSQTWWPKPADCGSQPSTPDIWTQGLEGEAPRVSVPLWTDRPAHPRMTLCSCPGVDSLPVGPFLPPSRPASLLCPLGSGQLVEAQVPRSCFGASVIWQGHLGSDVVTALNRVAPLAVLACRQPHHSLQWTLPCVSLDWSPRASRWGPGVLWPNGCRMHRVSESLSHRDGLMSRT